MKTFTLSAFLLLLAFGVEAQTPRLVLLEYFTQASCAPCATYNPTINAMLASNPNTVIALKYQTSWPGVDPMNAHNPTEVANRVTYYGVQGVPNGVIDGNYYNGHPNGINISAINARATAPSPFEITLSHTLSPNLDSIYVTGTVKATQAITQPLVARVAIIEKHISFQSPPGNNGETDFYSVMKKMLPNVNGISMPATMNVDDEIIISESWKLANVYDLNQLAVVAFVQNTSTKEVHQAALSAPQPLALDAGVHSVSVPFTRCSSTLDADLVVKNFGANDVTAIDIEYSVNGGTPIIMPWTGNIPAGSSTIITVPGINITGTSGTLNNISFTTNNPNGGVDLQPGNNSSSKSFHLVTNFAALPLYENFVATTFPPADWLRFNPDNGATWTRVGNTGGFGYSSNAAKMDFYNSAEGNVDELYIKPLNLTWSTSPNLYLNFHMAYAQYNSTYIDTLRVMISTDCGDTWTTGFTKFGVTMSTAPSTTTPFTPNASQWRNENVDLTPFIGEPEVLIKFQAASGYGNNLFIDDINISENAVSVDEINNYLSDLTVYPNPISGLGTVSFSLTESKDLDIYLLNVLGERVLELTKDRFSSGNHTININTEDLKSGIYFLTMNSDEGSLTRKLTLIK